MPQRDLADSDDEDKANWTHPGSTQANLGNTSSGPNPCSQQPNAFAIDECASTIADDEGAESVGSTRAIQNTRGEIGTHSVAEAATPQFATSAGAMNTSEAILDEKAMTDEVVPAEAASTEVPAASVISTTEVADNAKAVNTIEASNAAETVASATSTDLDNTSTADFIVTNSEAASRAVADTAVAYAIEEVSSASDAAGTCAEAKAFEDCVSASDAMIIPEGMRAEPGASIEVSRAADAVSAEESAPAGTNPDDGVSSASDTIAAEKVAFTDADAVDETPGAADAVIAQVSEIAGTNINDEAMNASDPSVVEESAPAVTDAMDDDSGASDTIIAKESASAGIDVADKTSVVADPVIADEVSASTGIDATDIISGAADAAFAIVCEPVVTDAAEEVLGASDTIITDETVATDNDAIAEASGPTDAMIAGMSELAGSNAAVEASNVSDSITVEHSMSLRSAGASPANIDEVAMNEMGEVIQPDTTLVTSNCAETTISAHNDSTPTSDDTAIITSPADAAPAEALEQEFPAPVRKPTFNARVSQKSLASTSMNALLSTARVSAAAAAEAKKIAEASTSDSSNMSSSNEETVSSEATISRDSVARAADAQSAAQIALAALAEADKEEEAAALAALAAAEEERARQSSTSSSDDEEEKDSGSMPDELVSTPEALDTSLPRGILLTASSSSRESSPHARRKRGSVQFALEGAPLPPPKDDDEEDVREEELDRDEGTGSRVILLGSSILNEVEEARQAREGSALFGLPDSGSEDEDAATAREKAHEQRRRMHAPPQPPSPQSAASSGKDSHHEESVGSQLYGFVQSKLGGGLLQLPHIASLSSAAPVSESSLEDTYAEGIRGTTEPQAWSWDKLRLQAEQLKLNFAASDSTSNSGESPSVGGAPDQHPVTAYGEQVLQNITTELKAIFEVPTQAQLAAREAAAAGAENAAAMTAANAAGSTATSSAAATTVGDGGAEAHQGTKKCFGALNLAALNISLLSSFKIMQFLFCLYLYLSCSLFCDPPFL